MSIRNIIIGVCACITVVLVFLAVFKPQYFKAREEVIIIPAKNLALAKPSPTTTVSLLAAEGAIGADNPVSIMANADPAVIIATSTQNQNKKITLSYVEEATSTLILNQSPEVRGIYATMWTVSLPSMRTYLLSLFDKKELGLNSIVINIKDDDGYIIFNQLKNTAKILNEFRQRNIRIIGRIVTFKDTKYTDAYPEAAFKMKADVSASSTAASPDATSSPDNIKAKIWHDSKGNAWIDPSNQQYREFIKELSIRAINNGFDEIQYDYFRFPSDGDLSKLDYDPETSPLVDFAAFLKENIALHAPISVDIFGQTLIDQKGSLGIGQNYLALAPYFDYISPMIYPSHYAPGNFGFKNPAEYPVEVIAGSLNHVASNVRYKIRPWLQAFNLGALYNKETIYAEINTTERFSPNGWLLWNPNNIYNL